MIDVSEYIQGFNDGCAHIKEDYDAGDSIELRSQSTRIAALNAQLKAADELVSKLKDIRGFDIEFYAGMELNAYNKAKESK